MVQSESFDDMKGKEKSAATRNGGGYTAFAAENNKSNVPNITRGSDNGAACSHDKDSFQDGMKLPQSDIDTSIDTHKFQQDREQQSLIDLDDSGNDEKNSQSSSMQNLRNLEKETAFATASSHHESKLFGSDSASEIFGEDDDDTFSDPLSNAHSPPTNEYQSLDSTKEQDKVKQFSMEELISLSEDNPELDARGQFQPHQHTPSEGRPIPEPDVSFDFHKFLQQLRMKSATPIVKYMKSFLYEFSRRHWTLNEQIRIVHNFFHFISEQMVLYEPWKSFNMKELDNAYEGVEKLIMNKLYTRTFSPCISEEVIAAGNTGHTEDLERDLLLREKIKIYGWIEEQHLEIPQTEFNGRFFKLAQQELLMMDDYRAPRDKIICVLNCCKILFGFLRHVGSKESADNFTPVLIYVILKAKCPFLISNVNYISRFRDPGKFSGEAEYYVSSLAAAISYIENIDEKSLAITHAEFESKVEEAVALVAQENNEYPMDLKNRRVVETDSETAPQRISRDVLAPARDFIQKNSEQAIRSIQRPLTTISRMIYDARDDFEGLSTQDQQSLKPSTVNVGTLRDEDKAQAAKGIPFNSDARLPNAASANRVRRNRIGSSKHSFERAAHSMELRDRDETLQTLTSMFPNIEKDVVELIVDAKGGRVGACVDALLELSAR